MFEKGRPRPARGRFARLTYLLALAGAVSCLAAAPGVAATPTPDRWFPEMRDATRWGPFLVDPSFSLDNLGYDGNIFLAPRDPKRRAELGVELKSDYIVRLGPEVTAQTRVSERIVVTLHDKAAYEAFLDTSSLNSLSNVFDAQVDVLFGPLLLTSKGAAQNTKWRPNSEQRARVRQRSETLEQTARLFVGPFTDAAAWVRRDTFQFTNPDQLFYGDTDFDGSLTIGQKLDRTTDTFGAEVGWRPGAAVRLFGRYTRSEATFKFSALRRDSEEKRRMVGVEFRSTTRLTGSAMVGRARLTNKDANTTYIPFDGTVWQAELAYRPTGTTRLQGRYERQLQYSTYQSNLYFRDIHRAISFETYLGSFWGITAGWDRRTAAYPNPVSILDLVDVLRVDETKDVFAGILLRFRGGLEMTVRAGHRTRDSIDPFAEDDSRYVSTSGNLRF